MRMAKRFSGPPLGAIDWDPGLWGWVAIGLAGVVFVVLAVRIVYNRVTKN